MTRKHFLKWVVALTLAASVTLLVAFNALLLWVATGPRSLDQLTPYLQAAFEPADNSYTVSIDQTWLIWDGWQHPVDIRLRDVKVNVKGQEFASFPELSVGLDPLSLLIGRLLPTSLSIDHPVMHLVQNDDRSLSLGFRNETTPAPEESPSVPLAVVLAPLVSPEDSGSLRKLRFVSIKNADVTVGNLKKETFFKAGDANIIFKRNKEGVVQAASNATITYGVYQSHIKTALNFSRENNIITGDVSVDHLMLSALASGFSDNRFLRGLQFPVSGKARVAVDTQGNVQTVNFFVDGGEGTFENDKLPAPMAVTTLHAEGSLANNATTITLSKLAADFGGMLVEGEGTATLGEEGTSVRAHTIAKNIPAKNIAQLWPAELAPQSREWIIANISEGVVSEAEANFNIAPGDLALPILPKESVDAVFKLSGAKIRYLPDHPQVSNVKATIHVDALSLDADIESGEFLKSTHLSGGKVQIDDLNADNPYIKVSFDASSTAKDIVHFLGLPRLKHAGHLNLSEESVEGTVQGNASVGFYFFAKHDASGKELEPEIDYAVTSQLAGVTQPNFMKKFDITGGTGTLTVDNKLLEFKGSGTVNGATVSDATVKYLFTPEDGFDTIIDATATAPVESLPRFGYPAWPFVKGAFGVHAKVKEGVNKELSEATVDLTNTAINMTSIGFIKPEKIPATLDLVAEKKNGAAVIKSFHLKGKDMESKGSADLNADMSDFSRISLDKAVYGDNDLDRVLYEQIEGGFRLDVHGKSADIQPWTGANDGPDQPGTFSFERFRATQIKIDVDTMVFGTDRTLQNVKGSLDCDAQQCQSADLSGATPDGKPVTARIARNAKGIRQFTLRAASAGAFLKSTNLFDGMNGGDLVLNGTYDNKGIFKGELTISEHTIKDAPVLAKILSLASLTGFFDTLRGDGIHFERLRAPFTLENDVVTFDQSKTFGSAMGMTMGGTLTFPRRTFDLKGTIVPSYSLNTVLGKVPLLGNVLTGGEGQGVFAASYSIKGEGKNPDISVNPLSILTPGFLRGLFDILDKPRRAKEEE